MAAFVRKIGDRFISTVGLSFIVDGELCGFGEPILEDSEEAVLAAYRAVKAQCLKAEAESAEAKAAAQPAKEP